MSAESANERQGRYKRERWRRTEENGGIAPVTKHGSASTRENWGCQCRPCMDVNRAQAGASRSERRSERKARRKMIDGVWVAVDAPEHGAEHGEDDTYNHWLCRCQPCTAAHAKRKRDDASKLRTRRKLIDGVWVAVEAPEHGKTTTYKHWYCRCQPCKDAVNRAQQLKRRATQPEVSDRPRNEDGPTRRMERRTGP